MLTPRDTLIIRSLEKWSFCRDGLSWPLRMQGRRLLIAFVDKKGKDIHRFPGHGPLIRTLWAVVYQRDFSIAALAWPFLLRRPSPFSRTRSRPRVRLLSYGGGAVVGPMGRTRYGREEGQLGRASSFADAVRVTAAPAAVIADRDEHTAKETR